MLVHVSEGVSASSCAQSETCVTVCPFLRVKLYDICTRIYHYVYERACMCACERKRAFSMSVRALAPQFSILLICNKKSFLQTSLN